MTKITIPTATEDQGRTLEDLLDMAKYLDEVVQIEHVSGRDTVIVRMASPYSYYQGTYAYDLGPEFVIDGDGSFTVESMDEGLLDELDVRFTRTEDDDPFVKVYQR